MGGRVRTGIELRIVAEGSEGKLDAICFSLRQAPHLESPNGVVAHMGASARILAAESSSLALVSHDGSATNVMSWAAHCILTALQ